MVMWRRNEVDVGVHHNMWVKSLQGRVLWVESSMVLSSSSGRWLVVWCGRVRGDEDIEGVVMS